MRTGENAFRRSTAPTPGHGARRARGERRLRPRDDRRSPRLDRAILEAYDFGRFGTIVDVGGGNGALLAAILAEHPAVHGVLFDQPHVVAGAGPVLERRVADRCRRRRRQLLRGGPAEGDDAYVLKSILHDWEDEEAIAILRVCRAAMAADGALLVIERISLRRTRTPRASSPTSTCS